MPARSWISIGNALQQEGRYIWLAELGVRGWAGIAIALAASIAIPLWHRAAGGPAPAVAALLWGAALATSYILVLADLRYVRDIGRHTLLAAFLGVMWVLLVGAAYLRFRQDRKRSG